MSGQPKTVPEELYRKAEIRVRLLMGNLRDTTQEIRRLRIANKELQQQLDAVDSLLWPNGKPKKHYEPDRAVRLLTICRALKGGSK